MTTLTLFATINDNPAKRNSADRVDAHPIVPGFERFAEVEEITDAERGHLLINELNCNSCHGGESSWPVAPKTAPTLTDVGNRIFAEHFESFLLDPHAAKPGTQMPDVLAGKPDQFGVVYQGYWSVPAEAKFTFRISSDDGARLIINGATIVDHDGIHGMTSKEGKRKFQAGVQDVRVEYFENDGGEDWQNSI